MRLTADREAIVSRVEKSVAGELKRLIPDTPTPTDPRRLLLACSGGPDSCALAAALAPLHEAGRLYLELAYIDHGLQSAGQRRAERAAVDDLGHRLGMAVHIRPVTVDADKGTGTEAAARRARYKALAQLREERGACAVCTAHHLDDQVETVLMRLLQGSSLAGLGGIHDSTVLYGCPVVRPMLLVDRRSIDRYVRIRKLKPHRDRSNRNTRFLRNRLRRRVIPAITSVRPGVREAVSRTARELREAHHELLRVPADTIPMSGSSSRVYIDKERFFSAPGPVRLERLRDACARLESVPHRLPTDMFRPLLGEPPPQNKLPRVDAHGVRIRGEGANLVCESRSLVRRDHPRYCHVVQAIPEAAGEILTVPLSDVLPRTTVPPEYAPTLVLTGPQANPDGEVLWSDRLLLRDTVLSDWSFFDGSRAGFKRRLQPKPDAYYTFEDAFGPVAILDLRNPYEPCLRASLDNHPDAESRRPERNRRLSVLRRGAQ